MPVERPKSSEFDIEDAAKYLNWRFRIKESALENTDILAQIPKPILVDFNCVLANNRSPFVVNPHGKEFLDGVRNLGDVVLITTASDWEWVKEFLEDFHMWDEKQVLMTLPNWTFAHDYSKNEKSQKLLDDYINLRNREDITQTEFKFDPIYYRKRVAPFFMKNYDIPLIDDSEHHTQNNPGIYGIQVEGFEPKVNPNYDGSVLTEALEKVKDHYAKLKLN